MCYFPFSRTIRYIKCSFNLPDYSYERYIIDSKSPTGDYLTWYRLYNDGWVEEGGFISVSGCGGTSTVQVGEPTFYFTQIDQKYNLHFDFVKTGAYWSWVELTCYKVSNNKIHLEIYNNSSNKWTANSGNGVYWSIAGMSTESSVNKLKYIKF